MPSMIRRGRWMVAVAVLLAPLGAVAPAGAATASKPYSLVIGTTAPTYETNPGPANNEVASGETVGITATFTNETGTQQLGSANLFWPSGFNVVSASPAGTATRASNCTLHGSPAGPCVQVRGLALAPGGSVTVTMSVTTPTGHQGNNGWQAEVKQANNFSGSPGNDLFLDPASQTSTFLDGASSLAFVNQPQNEVLNNAIDGLTPWFIGTAAATPVTVEVLDTESPPQIVRGFTGPVTAAIAVNPGGGTLGGDTTETPTNGTASFTSLNVSAPANGYQLSASSAPTGTVSGTTSTAFDAQGTFASCSGPGNSCHTNQTGTNGAALLTATVVSGSGLLLESVNANNGAQLTCSGSTSIDTNTYSFLTTGDLVASKVGTITMLGVKINGSVTKFLHAQQICFGATVDFITASGTFAPSGTLPDGSPGFIGVLPPCTGSSTNPCHDQNSDSATPVGTTYTVNLVADIPSAYAGDPWMR